MSFFVKNIKNKTQKVNGLKRKSTNDLKSSKKPKENGIKNKKLDDIDNEEIPSGSDDDILDNEIDGKNGHISSDYSDEEEIETAQEKKLRLAKAYLEQIEVQQDDTVTDVRAQISNQLRDDILEKTGKLKKLVSKNYINAHIDKELKGHNLSTTCVVVSNDSKYAFTGSKDGSIIKWEIETGRKLFRIKKKLPKHAQDKTKHGHLDKVYCLALTSDFKYLASAGVDKNIHIWDAQTCAHVYTFYGHRNTVSGLTFRQNTHELYSCSFDRSIKLWSVDELSYIETLYGHQDQILAIDSLNKERCVTCGARDRTLRLWKISEESQLIFQGTNFDSIDCLALINDDHFVSGSDDGSIALWHVSKKKPLFNVKQAHDTNSKWICSVAALHNTDLFASGSNDGHINVYACAENFLSFEEKFKIKIDGFVNDLKFTNDGKFLLAAVGQEHRLGRWEKLDNAKNNLVVIQLEQKNSNTNE